MAEWTEIAGVLLSQVGGPADALPVTEEAVAICRDLAAANPDRYCPVLARSLTNLAVRFSELGRPADALLAEQEAVVIRRDLAAADPDRYRPGLADCLTNLGIRFSELGPSADALPVTEEAVAICRDLAAANPDRYRPGLADCLTNLGIRFSELGRSADALPVTEEAVAICRDLAAANPDRYCPGLADCLNNFGVMFSELGRSADALPVTEEAVALTQLASNRHRWRTFGTPICGAFAPTFCAACASATSSQFQLGQSADARPWARRSPARPRRGLVTERAASRLHDNVKHRAYIRLWVTGRPVNRSVAGMTPGPLDDSVDGPAGELVARVPKLIKSPTAGGQ